jgi:hypothetical protein
MLAYSQGNYSAILATLLHLNSEAGNDEIQNFQRGDFYFVGITF